jgi:hypothetical protein
MRRAILAIESAGKYVIGVRPDGTLLVGNEPFDVASLAPANDNKASKWEDVRH